MYQDLQEQHYCFTTFWTKDCKERIPRDLRLCRKCFKMYKKMKAPARLKRDQRRIERLRAQNKALMKKYKQENKLKAKPTRRAEPVQTVVTARKVKTILRKAGSGTA